MNPLLRTKAETDVLALSSQISIFLDLYHCGKSDSSLICLTIEYVFFSMFVHFLSAQEKS